MTRSGVFIWLITVAVAVAVAAAAMLFCVVCATPAHHLVGGKELWKPNYNYTDWSLNETFYVGDLLHFVYDKHVFTVLEVNETSYKNCTDNGFIFNITGGNGSDLFELTKAKPYYFLAGGGYCNNGMKVAVNVVEFVPDYGSFIMALFGFFGSILSGVIFVWVLSPKNEVRTTTGSVTNRS